MKDHDFANAFGKIDRGVICHELCDLGIAGILEDWLHDLLSGKVRLSQQLLLSLK